MCTKEQAKKVIINWTGKPYRMPEYCQNFFTNWSLLNLYYNAAYTNLNGDKCKVLKFGEENDTMWSSVEDYARQLISLECVGNGEGPSRPVGEVLNATLFLRDFVIPCPSSCRKSQACSKRIVSSNNVKIFNLKFEALMRIVYQIRNNLFHGEKFALKSDKGILIAGGDEKQAERNKELIVIGNEILKKTLENLSQ